MSESGVPWAGKDGEKRQEGAVAMYCELLKNGRVFPRERSESLQKGGGDQGATQLLLWCWCL